MRMYAPSVDGDVLLACFDPEHRVALIRPESSAAGHPLRLRTVQRQRSEPYGRAARRLVRELAPGGKVRMGRVTGRIRSAAPEVASGWPARRRLVTAHVTVSGGACGGDGRVLWIAYAQAAGYAADMGIADLGLFLEGYVDGWIPDGWISLD